MPICRTCSTKLLPLRVVARVPPTSLRPGTTMLLPPTFRPRSSCASKRPRNVIRDERLSLNQLRRAVTSTEPFNEYDRPELRWMLPN